MNELTQCVKIAFAVVEQQNGLLYICQLDSLYFLLSNASAIEMRMVLKDILGIC